MSISHQAGAPTFDDAARTVISEEDFGQAWEEITRWQGYAATPLHSLESLADTLGVGAVHYKHEGPRFGLGSFKALGGAYGAQCVLREELSRALGTEVSLADVRNGRWRSEISQRTLVSATDGNHGRSLAWGCERFGARCRIYIHAEVSSGREAAIRSFGATVERINGDYDESVAICREEAQANGWLVISDTSWEGYEDTPRAVMAGYGVMFREVYEQLPAAPSHLFVQGGVGGLAAAAAASSRQLWGGDAPRIIVVEPELAACLFASARSRAMTVVAIDSETIMAGLSCGEPSPLAWRVLESEVADYLTIADELVPPAMRLLARAENGDPVIEAGESAVAGLAALMACSRSRALRDAIGLSADSEVLLLGTEGVTDPQIFAEIMSAA